MFKRYFSIFYLIIFLSFSGVMFAQKKPVLYRYADAFEVYTDSGSLGNNVLNLTAKDFFKVIRVKGESCIVTATYEDVIRDFAAVTVFSETTAYGKSFYAFSDKIPYKIKIGDNIVNLQYFVGENYNKLGTPMIFGGY